MATSEIKGMSPVANAADTKTTQEQLPIEGLKDDTKTTQEQLPKEGRSNYGDIVLYEKYIPELDCYRSAQKHCSRLSFPLDFAKPERPGTKRRSKPSDLKRKPCPLPIPEPPEAVPQEPPPDEDKKSVPKQSFCDKICSVCCCCCASQKEAPTEPSAPVAEPTEAETEPPPTSPQPTFQMPPKPQKGILKKASSTEVKVSKSVSIILPETDYDSCPPPSEPSATADVKTDSGEETETVTSFTATAATVEVVSETESLTTIFRCEEMASVIETSTSQPTSERAELKPVIQPNEETQPSPATSPKLKKPTGVSKPDKVAKEHPGKETEVGKSVPIAPPATSLPEPTTGTSPSNSTSAKTVEISPSDQVTMEKAASLPNIPSKSVLPRPHKSSRRYFTLVTPEALPQKKRDGEKTAPLPGRNWIHKFL